MTVPRDEHERTLAFADIALGQIRALGQAATPRNFEIWYHYATGYKPALNQSINETLAQKGALSEADLSGHTIPTSPPATSASGSIRWARACSTRSSRSSIWSTRPPALRPTIRTASQKLEHAKDGDALRAVIECLVQGAKEMELNNKKLETRLAASKQEIEQLQQNLETVRTESLTDPLTSLSNRKFFDSALGKSIADAKEKNQPLSLLMADIDHFKHFNDKYGHLTGDQVLRLVGLSVKQVGLVGKSVIYPITAAFLETGLPRNGRWEGSGKIPRKKNPRLYGRVGTKTDLGPLDRSP